MNIRDGGNGRNAEAETQSGMGIEAGMETNAETGTGADGGKGRVSPEPGSKEGWDVLEGRNAVLEALRAGRPMERILMQEGCQDGPLLTIRREAQRRQIPIKFVERKWLDQRSESGRHQGVIAQAAAYAYVSVEDMLLLARERGEAPFLILLDNLTDPHNLGAIIRTAHQAGAHGVILPKDRSVGLTAAVARTSAGAVNYLPVARVTNLVRTMEQLKKEGLWLVCGDMRGKSMYDLDLRGPVGLVIGSEGEGVSRLVRERCDLCAAIPMFGKIDSLNSSVAAGILAYEIVRQRMAAGWKPD